MFIEADSQRIKIAEMAMAGNQIIGASFLIVFMLPNFSYAATSVPAAIILLAMYSIFFSSVLSGIWIWNSERRGYTLGALVQFLQVPVLFTTPVSYKFVFGLEISLMFFGSSHPILIGFGGQAYLSFANTAVDTQVGINICAVLVLLYFVSKVYRKVELNCQRM